MLLLSEDGFGRMCAPIILEQFETSFLVRWWILTFISWTPDLFTHIVFFLVLVEYITPTYALGRTRAPVSEVLLG